MPMGYIVPSIHIAAFTNMDDPDILEERVMQLTTLEKDRFMAKFHQQVQKTRDKAWHDRHIH